MLPPLLVLSYSSLSHHTLLLALLTIRICLATCDSGPCTRSEFSDDVVFGIPLRKFCVGYVDQLVRLRSIIKDQYLLPDLISSGFRQEVDPNVVVDSTE